MIDTRRVKPFSKDLIDLLRDKQDVSTITPYYHFYIDDLRVSINHREVDCVNRFFENQHIHIEIGDYTNQIILENPKAIDD